MKKKRHIIIGASAAGIGAANALARFDADAEIICIAREQILPYNTCFLADALSRHKEQHELLLPIEHIFNEPHRTLRIGVTVEQVIPADKQIICSDGTTLTYDTLFLGTGYTPVQLAHSTEKLAGYFSYYYADDVQAMDTFIARNMPQRAIIIGGGINGLECADALRKRGLQVTVLVRSGQVLAGLVSHDVAAYIEQKMAEVGVTVRHHAHIEQIVSKNGHVVGIELADGTYIPADMVVASIGSRSNSALAQQAGLDIVDGAVVVNEYMQTSDAAIWAGGDCARIYDIFAASWQPNKLWQEAMRQGMIAGKSMAGCPQAYDGAYNMVESHIFGMQFAAAGRTCVDIASHSATTSLTAEGYSVVVGKEGVLVGFVLIGQHVPATKMKRALAMSLSIHQLL